MIKIFEEWTPPLGEYSTISLDEYNRLNTKILTLSYYEQESIINLFKRKFTVSEELKPTWIENGAVIGFNRKIVKIGYSMHNRTIGCSCWINVNTVKIMPPTKKWLEGRRVENTNTEIIVSKIEDDWFLVQGFKIKGVTESVKCDQLDGLLQYFKNKFDI